MVIPVEYVAEEDTLAIVTIKETQSASLRTTNAILIAGLLIASYFLNILFIVAVIITKSFRTTIYLMYCHLTLINILDLSFNILFALIYVANGNWNMSNRWCTFNVAVQEFVHLHTLFVLMLIGIERAMGMVMGPEYVIQGKKYLPGKKVFGISLFLTAISSLFASVVFLSAIPTKPFRNRYVCGIDSGGPIGYVIARVAVYFGILIVILVAVATILKKRTAASLPQNSQEYTEFIKRNRAMQEHRSRAKLMILITTVFILVEGPYITLCFFYESYNSREFSEETMDIPQDADTLITWLKFVFPLLCPIIILCWCNDVWLKVKEVMCCRSYEPPTIGHYMPHFRGVGGVSPTASVMTIVGTDDGVQLHLPSAPHNEPDTRSYMGPTFTRSIPTHSSVAEDPVSHVRDTQTSPIHREPSPAPTTTSRKSLGTHTEPSRIPKPVVDHSTAKQPTRGVIRIRPKKIAKKETKRTNTTWKT